ncbi:MAG: biotin/lipoyl-binding protein, partial [Methylococcaceae bacterium]|nr:biotin/lipoyl-binding protein [Methylococcaceae bacterium]
MSNATHRLIFPEKPSLLFCRSAHAEDARSDIPFANWARHLRGGLLTALTLTAMTGCGNPSGAGAKAAQFPPPNVKVVQPRSQEVTEWDEYTGRIEAVNSVDVRSRVDGYLEKVNFKAGDRVKKGDLLFSIDPRPFKAQMNRVQA